ncbi:MAG: tRNA (adenosine(37)-N6)-threonylcarbamoyltransferase complex transferase subunit TsaD [Candidatus Aegiribacteria sp.]|nr:tRNA (adenosine(37)-N6)-threonylcarbamoyltransferase complex transferase subunit TsaD [Candidatus Aegiribacteria sp.]
MLILAVETSCDDTAVALLEGCSVIAERVYSQEVHSKHGGVVPELASRSHMKILPGLVSDVLLAGGMDGLENIDVLAATAGPGLTGSLLVGLAWAKAAAWAAGKRFLGINHLAAHIYIHYGQKRQVAFPAVALLVSGGHTSLFQMKSWREILLLGSTRDDAAGEAFDKTAKLAGLGYPGGVALDIAADRGNPRTYSLPSPMPDPALPEFSFSGLKTAAKLLWEKGAILDDLAASFRKTVVDLLISKSMCQCELLGAKSFLAAGGVTANRLLRKNLRHECSVRNLELFLPVKEHSTDNAVMVGRAAAAIIDRNPEASSPLSCNAFARWSGRSLSPIGGS